MRAVAAAWQKRLGEGAVEDLFQDNQGAGHAGAVQNAVVVGDADVDGAVGRDDAVVKGGRQGGEGMKRFGAESGVDADAKRPPVASAFVTRQVEAEPPQKAAQRARQAGHAQRAAESADPLQRSNLALLDVIVQLLGRVVLRFTDLDKEHGILVMPASFDGDRGNAGGVFIQVRPWNGQISPAQLGAVGGYHRVRLGEQGAPIRPRESLPPSE